jgi:hypothetical protein
MKKMKGANRIIRVVGLRFVVMFAAAPVALAPPKMIALSADGTADGAWQKAQNGVDLTNHEAVQLGTIYPRFD